MFVVTSLLYRQQGHGLSLDPSDGLSVFSQGEKMSQPFVGQIACVGFNFAPVGWQFCNGALLPISEYDTLFNLIGTTYGGDGQSTFAVPDLRGRTPVGTGGGSNYSQGQTVGVETVTLTTNQIPSHTHLMPANSAAPNSGQPNGMFGSGGTLTPYGSGGSPSSLAVASVSLVGGSQPHDNRQPYLALNWIISLFGIYPSQN